VLASPAAAEPARLVLGQTFLAAIVSSQGIDGLLASLMAKAADGGSRGGPFRWRQTRIRIGCLHSNSG